MSAQTDVQSIADALFALEASLSAIPFSKQDARGKCAILHTILQEKAEEYADILGFVPSEIQGGGTNKPQ